MSAMSVEAIVGSGAPRAGITVTGLPSGVSSLVTISRTVPNEGTTIVRGIKEVPATGAGFWNDFEVPLNVDVTYTLSVVGSSEEPRTASLTVASDDLWLQDPLLPRNAIRVSAAPGVSELSLMGASFAQLSYAQPVDTVVPLGASVPVSSIGQRLVAGKIPLRLAHTIADEGAALLRLLMGSGTLLLRGAPPELHLPANAYIRVGDVTHEPLNPSAPGTLSVWSMTVDLDRGPAVKLVVPWWTYDEVSALWPGKTYRFAMDALPKTSYLDWLRDPEQL